ncbi:GFA family protein [Aureimonas sp. SA4125]|uniref:GFA family protein n=1 Tax=Aureimonas sp. SA4125 TaxID=2826993 RepID=UPI0031F61201
MADTRGACRCGQVMLRMSGKPLMTMACHCTGCQKMTASAFSLSSLFAAEAFDVADGNPVLGALHGEHRHFFARPASAGCSPGRRGWRASSWSGRRFSMMPRNMVVSVNVVEIGV